MKTPKEYRDNLLNHIITKQMLVDCLYSVNKRAKNYRDKERKQRAYSRCHRYVDNSAFIEGAREKKLEMYRMKDMLLQILTPICIHKEFIGYKTERIYSYETEEYKKYKKQFFYEGHYMDDDYSIVYFGDVELKDEPIYHYYLFYDLDCGHTFHTPIKKEELDKYSLPIIEISELETTGHKVNDLVSVQFVRKVIQLIEENMYILQ